MFWMPNKNDAMKTAAALLAAYAVLTACWVYPGVVFSHAATTNTVLFDREIVRILDEHCVMCHVEGGPSFSLATYEETWLKSQLELPADTRGAYAAVGRRVRLW